MYENYSLYLSLKKKKKKKNIYLILTQKCTKENKNNDRKHNYYDLETPLRPTGSLSCVPPVLKHNNSFTVLKKKTKKMSKLDIMKKNVK